MLKSICVVTQNKALYQFSVEWPASHSYKELPDLSFPEN